MEPVRFDLDGQVALVTGAGRGIGHDLALALAAAGARSVAGVRRRGRGPGGLEAVELDLREGDSMRAAVDQVRPRILVNNAGLGTNPDALDATEDEWNELLEVNLRGLFFEPIATRPGLLSASVLSGNEHSQGPRPGRNAKPARAPSKGTRACS
jgi:NAD(P)-dependent dehydrogenase (short-subunit alcohol dehydrogenase family)